MTQTIPLRLLLFALLTVAPARIVAGEADAPVRRLDAAPARLAEIFAPYRTEHATLSPDGRYLAYSEREGASSSLRWSRLITRSG